ncbi:MAG: MarC family protein [Bacteroidetes bacterium]|uniref:UPF0056 membrane protein n=1 Tax=Candidatus Gallipaludibacter merdavium TaxID=2840839 RepID=A0A9D9HTE9_9BACT|nr:MarC family protein [Candidatus Gallipaludibacter merdavium]
MDSGLLTFAILCFTSFFTLANPLGTMPVFLNQTEGCTEDERKAIAKKSTIVAFFTLVIFAFFGRYIFLIFGVSTDAFRIAGGIIIFKIGYDMLQAHITHIKLNETERKIQHYTDNIAITPLAIPMLCGPGSIANGIVLMEDAETAWYKVAMIVSIALVYLITFLILRASNKLYKLLGETGSNVMMRLMGLILMVIAVECMISGLKPVLSSIISMA